MRIALKVLSFLNPRGLKRRLRSCCLVVGLGLLLACGLIGFLVGKAMAQEPAESAWELLVVVDNSNSMFERSDPAQLRIAATKLFINYLGVDSSGATHRLGVISFGGEAQLVASLTPLTDEARRAELASLIENPQPMRWTNLEAALALAEQTLPLTSSTRQAIVLLTDGKPEWGATPTETQKAATIARLREQAGRFAAREIPLFIILLQNEATKADPEIEQLYAPLWQALAAATPPGRFFRAQQSEDLLGIYHDIVVALTERQSAGVVVETQVQTETIELIDIEPGLAQVTLVIRKSEPALQAQIFQPNGEALTPNPPAVQYAGQPGHSSEEIWAIRAPSPGSWQVQLTGQGTVTVRKDYYPASPTPTLTPSPVPTFTPTFTPVPAQPTTPPATPMPTRTPGPTATSLPVPTRLAPTPPATASILPVFPLPIFLFWGLGLPLLAVIVGGGWYWFRLRQAKPELSGGWRLSDVPPTAGSVVLASLELDTLHCRELTTGGRPMDDIHLPTPVAGQPPPSVRLRAEIEPDGLPGVSVAPVSGTAGPIQLNNLPLSGPRFLRDGDIVTLGGYRFKYENLRRRREWRNDRREVGDKRWRGG